MDNPLVLYAIPISAYCAKVRVVLRHKGLVWQELPPPGGYGSHEYKNIVPSGNLPALNNGALLLADSEAINEYLNEAYPTPGLLSEDINVRSKQRERSRFHDTRLEPALRTTYTYLPPNALDREHLNQQSEQISLRLEQLGRMLGASDGLEFSLGDCGYPGTFAWLDAVTPVLGLKIGWPTSILNYRQWLQSHKSVEAELSVLVPAIREWLSARH